MLRRSKTIGGSSADSTTTPLHTAFEREVSEGAIAAVLLELLVKKLRGVGVTLSERQRKELLKRLRAADYARLQVGSWKFWQRKSIELEITESDVEELGRSTDAFLERLPTLVESMSDDLASQILNRLHKRWARQARHEQRIERGFRKRLDRRWHRPFNRLEMLLTIARELGDSINNRHRGGSMAHPHMVDVLTRLHARACQIGAEVVVLLRNGFADGALARWRSLHEVAVVSLFISKGDDNLAERYSLHQVVESRRAADEYQRYCDRIGYERVSAAEIHEYHAQSANLVKRYGAEYREPYGWAAQRLGLKSPTIADIERAAEIDHLRPFYRMASHNVHANPKGVFFKLGLVGEADILLTGPSNVGLADPGGSTASSILQVTSGLVTLDTTLDVIVTLKLMMILSAEVADAFEAVQREIESEVA
jgi:Family of unknown function (DUF5677)